jgi:hypothetical protein
MNKYELTKYKVTKLISKEIHYEFPNFLVKLRECFGLTRRSACAEMKFPEMKMYHLENGTFRKHVDYKQIQTIAEYYDIDSQLLKAKADEFITENKGQPQHDHKKYYKPKREV